MLNGLSVVDGRSQGALRPRSRWLFWALPPGPEPLKGACLVFCPCILHFPFCFPQVWVSQRPWGNPMGEPRYFTEDTRAWGDGRTAPPHSPGRWTMAGVWVGENWDSCNPKSTSLRVREVGAAGVASGSGVIVGSPALLLADKVEGAGPSCPGVRHDIRHDIPSPEHSTCEARNPSAGRWQSADRGHMGVGSGAACTGRRMLLMSH